MKLELKHLAPYLPYGLKVNKLNMLLKGLEKEKHKHYYALIEYLNEKGKCRHCNASIHENRMTKNQIWCTRPILYPLSDLTKEIEHNGEKFVPIDEIERLFTIEITSEGNGNFEMANILLDVLELPYCIVEKLFEWHFDCFSLIENNLAIDINTLNK